MRHIATGLSLGTALGRAGHSFYCEPTNGVPFCVLIRSLKATYKFYTQIDTRHPPTPFVGERLKMLVLRRDGRTRLLVVSLLGRSLLHETSRPWIHHVEQKGVYKHLVQEPVSKLSKCGKNHLQQQFRRKLLLNTWCNSSLLGLFHEL